ncbi:MAG: glutamate--tRNA ligase [bacterium]
MKKIRVRFAPSPTGSMHIGNLRTALYAYCVAKQNQGDFIVRIEDTDQSRFIDGAVDKVFETLKWAGLNNDEGVMMNENGVVSEKGEYSPYFQSKRLDIYKQYVTLLLEKGVAYPCFCSKERLDNIRKEQQLAKKSPKYDKCCLALSKAEAEQRIDTGEEHVIRLNIPSDKIITFTDAVYGKISVPGHSLDDQVLIKSDGFPTYHFAVVVDDHLMEISHVIRGEDWIPSAPKHVLLYEYFGWEMPTFVHLPNILGDNKKKLSKRQGDVSVEDFIDKGYLPEAVINFIAFLGWHPKEDKDVMSITEIISEFDVSRIQKAGAKFDREKLDWLNGYYIKQLSIADFMTHAHAFLPNDWKLNEAMILSVQPRIKTFSELKELVSFYFDIPDYDVSLLQWKDMNIITVRENLIEMHSFIDNLPEEALFTTDELLKIVLGYLDASGKNRGEVLWPLRVALSGQKQSPSPFEIMAAIGKEKSLERIDSAMKKVEECK